MKKNLSEIFKELNNLEAGSLITNCYLYSSSSVFSVFMYNDSTTDRLDINNHYDNKIKIYGIKF